jgi:hypothetical protein
MKVLVACEFSGVVRDAFTAAGHLAWSCDLEPSETPGFHHQGDVRDLLTQNWDLIIAHPPCTHLANSGARWWPNKLEDQAEALSFVFELTQARCLRIAIENPVGRLNSEFRKPDQIIQPWQFGVPEWKTTCLWLKGLPKLAPTNIVTPDQTKGGGKRPGRISSRIHRMGPGPKRQAERSRTFPGIAAAMAAQWGEAA